MPDRGLGKCVENHSGSFGYPTRPNDPYAFCSQCGNPMVWACASCSAGLPDDNDELTLARYCRHCGAGYFDGEPPADRGT